jgi:type II secretory pathway pseudopilin PulG
MKQRRRLGFTLVELILVMIVLFTVATIVAPRMSDFFPGFRVQKCIEHLYAWARKARADAGTTGLRQRLLLDPVSRKYWIESEARPFKEPGKFSMLGGAWGEEKLPEGINFETMEGTEIDPVHGSCRYVEFRPDGTSTEATLSIVNDRYDRKTLRIEGATSKIYMQTQEQKQ